MLVVGPVVERALDMMTNIDVCEHEWKVRKYHLTDRQTGYRSSGDCSAISIHRYRILVFTGIVS